MAGNVAFGKAAKAKQDEFYTRLEDIESELKNYWDHFRDKVVFCNCDDPYESNFFKYFAMNFNHLGLKKLIATSYAGSPITGAQLPLSETAGLRDALPPRQPYKVEITEVPDLNDDGAIDLVDVERLLRREANVVSLLKGDGGFQSPECVALLDEADIVVSNPPFSLWRAYMAQLIKHEKKFLIIGNQNNVAYKEIFPLFKTNQMWFGYRNGDMAFRVPDSYEPRETRFWVDETGQKWRSMGNIGWFTNLDINKRHESLTLYKRYKPEDYPTYTNYPNAIEVKPYTDIPVDYDGEMGVPIGFLQYHNPEQFEIVGYSGSLARPMIDYAPEGTFTKGGPRFYLPEADGKYRRLYVRIVIKRIGDQP